MKKIKVGICQLKVTHNKIKNLKNAESKIRLAKRKGARLVVLPEMFNCPYQTEKFKEYAEAVPQGMTCRMLGGLARELNIYLAGGSIPEAYKKRIFNTAPVFSPQGKLIARHRKMHLFDVCLKNVVMRESDVLTAGDSITCFNTPFGTFGLLICYDARFPELFRLMLKKDIAAVIMPGAFSTETGKSHWKMVIRTRAVDNQIYMVAASPARDPGSDYVAFGHSMIVDPWGDVLAEAGAKEAVVTAWLDPARLGRIRKRIPLLKHRREDCYSVNGD